MVGPAAPLVPVHEDCRRIPELALADRVDDGSDPMRAEIASASAVIGVGARGRNPRDVRQEAVPDVVEDPVCGEMTSFDQSLPYRI